MNKNTNAKTPKMSDNERARLQAFKNVQDKNKLKINTSLDDVLKVSIPEPKKKGK